MFLTAWLCVKTVLPSSQMKSSIFIKWLKPNLPKRESWRCHRSLHFHPPRSHLCPGCHLERLFLEGAKQGQAKDKMWMSQSGAINRRQGLFLASLNCSSWWGLFILKFLSCAFKGCFLRLQKLPETFRNSPWLPISEPF